MAPEFQVVTIDCVYDNAICGKIVKPPVGDHPGFIKGQVAEIAGCKFTCGTNIVEQARVVQRSSKLLCVTESTTQCILLLPEDQFAAACKGLSVGKYDTAADHGAVNRFTIDVDRPISA